MTCVCREVPHKSSEGQICPLYVASSLLPQTFPRVSFLWNGEVLLEIKEPEPSWHLPYPLGTYHSWDIIGYEKNP